MEERPLCATCMARWTSRREEEEAQMALSAAIATAPAGLLLRSHSPRIRFVAVEPKASNVFCELTATLTVRRLTIAVLGMKSNLFKGKAQQRLVSAVLDPVGCCSPNQR